MEIDHARFRSDRAGREEKDIKIDFEVEFEWKKA